MVVDLGRTDASFLSAITQAMVDNAPTNMMFADRDFVIRYINPASDRTLRTLEEHLPIKVDQMVGASLDIFHKKPEYQRDILKDDTQLPRRAYIKVGPEILDLLVSPIHDHAGAYTGAMATWDVVTEKLHMEAVSKEAALNATGIEAVVKILSDSQTIPEVLSGSMNAIRDVYGMNYGVVYQVSDEDRLQYVAESGAIGRVFAEYVRTADLVKGQGLAGKTWQGASAQFLPSLQDAYAGLGHGPIEEANVNATYSIPLVVNGRVTGVMNYYSIEVQEASAERTKALDSIGKMVAQSLHWIDRQEQEVQQNIETARRVQLLLDAAQSVQGGDLTVTIDDEADDNVGHMAEALNSVIVTLRNNFAQISGTASALSSSAAQLTGLAEGMQRDAATSAERADAAVASSAEVSSSIQTVASAAEQMTASIREIATNATQAASVANSAVSVAASAQTTVASLGESSAEIGQVIKVITSIAQQTNLLALNATIEAARAGEAGKGFAVVANEVKELAKATAEATEDISHKIEAIQSDTESAVTAIGEIAQVIGHINDIQTTIASAVEEQTATTNEIARSVTDAAAGMTGIADGAVEVAAAATETQKSTSESLGAATEVNGAAEQLTVLVGQYTI